MNHLVQTAMKCSQLTRITRQNRMLPSAFYVLPKPFSADVSNTSSSSFVDGLFQTTPAGVVYGRLTNIFKYTTKNDIINLLECGLSPEKLKIEYSRSYFPTSVVVEFPAPSAYDQGLRAIGKKGRVFTLSRADKSQWDVVAPYDGKAIIMLGIPPSALISDVERVLSGFQYDSSSIQLFTRPMEQGGTLRMALVRFSSSTSAMHAYITKNRGFCLNNQISIQLLH